MDAAKELKAVRRHISEARWHTGMASDLDNQVYAALEEYGHALSALARLFELLADAPSAPAAEAAPREPVSGQHGLEQAPAAGVERAS